MSNFNLTLSPAQIEYVLKPGVSLIQTYTVTNNSNTQIRLSTEILPWIPSGTDGSINYSQATNNPNIDFSLANADLKIGETFILNPNSSKQLILKIKTSSNLTYLDSYYTLFISQEKINTTPRDTFSSATGKIGSHILLTTSDTENPKVEAQIQDFKISPKIKDVFLRPITFEGKIKNNSQFFFKSDGKIIISKNDKVIKELILNQDNVLNYHSRNFSCNQEYLCQINPPLWPGHYQVSLILNENLNAKNYETSFFVLPITPFLLILLLSLLLIFKKILNKLDIKK